MNIIIDYEKGEKVFIDIKGELNGPFTVKGHHDNMLTRMISFEETTLCCGVCYVKRTPDQVNGKMSEYLWTSLDKSGKQRNFINNVLDEGVNEDNYNGLQMEGITNRSGLPDLLFFRPDHKMIEWIGEYANGRIIIDIGCGAGRLTESLHWEGFKVVGIDPFGDASNYGSISISSIKNGKGIIHFITKRIEECGKFFQGAGKKVLLLFARPCHSDFVYNALKMKDKETEALYITVPENIHKYNDLGHYKERAVKIIPEGRSADNEVFYSIK